MDRPGHFLAQSPAERLRVWRAARIMAAAPGAATTAPLAERIARADAAGRA